MQVQSLAVLLGSLELCKYAALYNIITHCGAAHHLLTAVNVAQEGGVCTLTG